MEWTQPAWIPAAILLALAVLGLGLLLEARKRALCRRFAASARLRHAEPSPFRRGLRWAMLALAAGLLALALADPRLGVEVREVSHRGRDLIFVLDVSKSMLATDITPSRLSRAKLDILDRLGSVEGHRLGLLLFAGNPKESCPLTWDYRHFAERLKAADPAQVPLGGTNLGDALRKALELIKAGAGVGNTRDIVLITDGQDLTGFYEEAAKEAGQMQVSVYTVGIGGPKDTDIRLPDGRYVEQDGKRVTTALNPEPLQLISRLSGGGFYQDLSANPDWLAKILRHMEKKEQAASAVERHERKIPRYAWFVGPAMLLLAGAALLRDRAAGKEAKT